MSKFIKNLIPGFYRQRDYLREQILQGYKIRFDYIKNITAKQVEVFYQNNFIAFDGEIPVEPITEFVSKGVHYVPVFTFDALTFRPFNLLFANSEFAFHGSNKKSRQMKRKQHSGRELYEINCIIYAHTKNFCTLSTFITNTIHNLRKADLSKLNTYFHFSIDIDGCNQYCSIEQLIRVFCSKLTEYSRNKKLKDLQNWFKTFTIIADARLMHEGAYDIISRYSNFNVTKKMLFLFQIICYLNNLDVVYSIEQNFPCFDLLMTNSSGYPLIRDSNLFDFEIGEPSKYNEFTVFVKPYHMY
jgi:hypothetical protein